MEKQDSEEIKEITYEMEEGEMEMEEGEFEHSEVSESQKSEYVSESEKSQAEPNSMIPATKMSETTFKQLGVSPWLIENLATVGINIPTSIQAQTLAHSLKNTGEHIIGCAHTGSGKTACFAIPILQKLAKDSFGIFALIVTPTRELAFQIRDQFLVFAGQTLNLRITVIVGGMDMMRQSQELSNIPHIIITTPGRFVHQLTHDQAYLHEYLENL